MAKKWTSVLLLAVMAMRGLILGGTVTTAGMYVIAIVSAAISVLLLSASLAGKSES